MRERPLSITIMGWFVLTLTTLGLILWVVVGPPTVADSPGDFSKLNWYLEIIIFGLLAIFSVLILKGNSSGRAGLTTIFVLDLLRIIFLDWEDSRFEFLEEVIVDLFVITVIYLPRNRSFFHAKGQAPPLTYQAGTALCYGLITLLLVPVLATPAGFALWDLPGACKLLLVAFVAAGIYGAGNALGMVLNPRRDLGTMLIIAAIASLIFCIGLYVNLAGSLEAAWQGSGGGPNVNLWISAIATVLFVACGITLVRGASGVRSGPTD